MISAGEPSTSQVAVNSTWSERNTHVRTAATLLAGLAALATAATPGPARAAAPYPKSTVITGITWDTGTHRWSGAGGDIWPVTWAQDGTLRTAWGDGVIGCNAKVSYGVAAITSATPSPGLQTVSCGPAGVNRGKIMTLLAAGGNLYAVLALEGAGSGFPVWRSTDGGRLWLKPTWSFPSFLEAFVQFGRANAGAPGGHAYLLDARTTSVHLMRVPQASAQTRSAYEYFAGTSDAPAWSKDASRSKAVFADPAGTWRPQMTYNPGLKRYLLTVAHSKVGLPSSDRMGVFEGPAPWGPWRTVSYVDDFLGMRGGWHLGLHFPVKWQADGGRTLWATFSCHDNKDPGSCGKYHDRFNLMKATLTVGGAAGS
jgi:hypothetical protein